MELLPGLYMTGNLPLRILGESCRRYGRNPGQLEYSCRVNLKAGWVRVEFDGGK